MKNKDIDDLFHGRSKVSNHTIEPGKCIGCGNETYESDRICEKCDTDFPNHLPLEQYEQYFKVKGKDK